MRGIALLLVLFLTACAGGDEEMAAFDPFGDVKGIPYETAVTGAPTEAFQELVEKSLRLYLMADKPPQSRARLARRADSDMETLGKILRAEGYYKGKVAVEITDLPPGEDEDAPRLRVALTIDPGPQFTMASQNLAAPALGDGLALPDSTALGLEPGAPARAADIVAVEAAAVNWLTENGFPFAEATGRRAVADLDANSLAVTSAIDPGPRVRYGAMRIEGLTSVDGAYLRTYQPWQEGDIFKASNLGAMQRRLLQTGLFEFVAVRHGEKADLDAGDPPAVPIIVQAEEALHRTVGGGLRFSTAEGIGARAYIEHRNLFGANETGRLTLTAGLETQRLEATFRKPQYLLDRQDLTAGASVAHVDEDVYKGFVATANVGLERRLSDHLTVGLGVTAELAAIDQDDVDKTSYLLGVPLTVTFDASDDLFDPTRGIRAQSSLTPYGGVLADDFTGFLIFDNKASTYIALDEENRYIIAIRGRLGTILGVARDDIPPTRRLYSGGGGSVRGYESRFVGPLDADGDPEGGRSVLEAGVELRYRITDTIGIVPFVEAGTVSDQMFPDFDAGLQLAAGLGLRYYTAIGPMRVDLAVPLNPRDEDGAFQFYIAVGQAF